MSSSDCVDLALAAGVGVADLDDALAIARLGRLHALVEGIDRSLVALGQRQGFRREGEAEREQRNGGTGKCGHKPQRSKGETAD
jgi:hypothetical protein